MQEKEHSSYWAYQILHIGFMVTPIVVGLDKFTDILTNWNMYPAPAVARVLPMPTHIFMRGIGAIEICAGIIVAVRPRLGGRIICAWLIAVIINLLLARGFYDIALRDLGLALGALSLSFLSRECACKT